MKIIELSAENIKRIKAIEIRPKGNMVVLEGKNEQGKTSIMDCIAYALGGTKLIPQKPIRNGEKTAQIMLDIGEYVITRKWNKVGNTSLKVETKDGAKPTSPQKMLDDLIGELSFDPLEFCNLKKEKRIEILKSITGLDFRDLEKKYTDQFQERTFAKKKVKELEAQIVLYKTVDNPGQIESIKSIQMEKARADENNQKCDSLAGDVEGNRMHLKTIETRIDELERELANEEEKKVQAEKDVEKSEHLSIMSERIDTKQFDEKIADHSRKMVEMERWNRKVEVKANLKNQEASVENLNNSLENIKIEKESRIKKANMPIPDLNFSNGDITYKSVSFSEISSAQKIIVSMAIAMALNPKLRIIRILNGSLLDDDAMKTIEVIAEKHDFQIWVEKVSNVKSGNAIFVEEGEIK